MYDAYTANGADGQGCVCVCVGGGGGVAGREGGRKKAGNTGEKEAVREQGKEQGEESGREGESEKLEESHAALQGVMSHGAEREASKTLFRLSSESYDACRLSLKRVLTPRQRVMTHAASLSSSCTNILPKLLLNLRPCNIYYIVLGMY